MTSIEKLLVGAIVLIGLALLGWLNLLDYGVERYDEGFEAAIKIGMERRDADAEINRQIETDLRKQLGIKDTAALKKEKDHAQSLAAAQRRILTGTDSLRCPARPVPATATTSDRPTASGPAADDNGPEIVPEAAADLVGIASDVERLVRQYDRVVDRFEACRAMNAR
jgi:hypothetical protein